VPTDEEPSPPNQGSDAQAELLRRLKRLEAEMQAMRMSVLAERTFELEGRTHSYMVARGNRTWDNERAIELPVGWEAVQAHGHPQTVIEVGNVLGHYYPIEHVVLDKFEHHRCVTWNEDVLEFQPPFAPELVVSISTLEHVGHGEQPRQPEKFRQAVEAIIGWLAPGGRLLFTAPLGYNPSVLEYLDDPSPQVTSMLFMRRTTLDNLWVQTSLPQVRDYRYGAPFPCANALAIVEATRAPSDPHSRFGSVHGRPIGL